MKTKTAARLRSIADRIQTQDELCRMSARRSLDAAVEAGRLLQEAKSLVGHGGWLLWLKKSCPFLSERTAQRYLSLAKFNPAKLADLKKPTLGRALASIVRDLKPDHPGDVPVAPRPVPASVTRGELIDHSAMAYSSDDAMPDDQGSREGNIRLIEETTNMLLKPKVLRALQSEQRARLRTVATAILDALDPAVGERVA